MLPDYADLEQATGHDWFALDPNLTFLLDRHLPDIDDRAFAQQVVQPYGALVGVTIAARAEETDAHGPVLQRYDKWGYEVGEVLHHPTWLANKADLVRTGFVGLARLAGRPVPAVVTASRAYLVSQAETAIYCALGMTGGAADIVERYAPDTVRDQFVDRLTGLDPDTAWEGGMFLTERQGGSDVGANTTVARQDGEEWILYGDKHFCSNVDADLFIVLARPSGAADGTRGLSTFIVPRRLPDGTPNGFTIKRLKPKLGTIAVPTAEVTLHGARAWLAGPGVADIGDDAAGAARDGDDAAGAARDGDDAAGAARDGDDAAGAARDGDDAAGAARDGDDAAGAARDGDDAAGAARDGRGINRMMEMVNASRFGVALMGLGIHRRSFLEAAIYAARRTQWRQRIDRYPLVRETLVDLLVDLEAGMALTYECAVATRDAVDPEQGRLLRRILIPLAKARTTREALSAASAALEVHGGNGYMTDWPMARQLRDAQCHTIWEGTDNILSLDVRRAIRGEEADRALFDRVELALVESAGHPVLDVARRTVAAGLTDAQSAVAHLARVAEDLALLHSRRLAGLLADVTQGALLLHDAAWSLERDGDARKAVVARRFVSRRLANPPVRGLLDDERTVLDLFEPIVRYGRVEVEDVR